jgi:hypothetical protein
MIEAMSTSETSVSLYHTTRRNITDDSHLHTRQRETLKSHQVFLDQITQFTVRIFSKCIFYDFVNIPTERTEARSLSQRSTKAQKTPPVGQV